MQPQGVLTTANVNDNSTTTNTKDDMFVELDDVPQQLDPYFE
jgi:hypothetical protein